MQFLRVGAAVLLLCAGPLHANPLTHLLTGTEPCRSLPGIDRTDRAEIDSADIHLDGEIVELNAVGRLSCKSAEGALIRADASVRLTIVAQIDLSTCAVTDAGVRLDRFGGSAAPVLEAGRDMLEVGLVLALRDSLAQGCRDLGT